MLVDSTIGHSMLSFMDGFFGCNQILMALEDMEKTSFITKWGTYYYRVMPFGLKNARTTYQRAATTLFHDMMHRDVEKSIKWSIVANHLALLPVLDGRVIDDDFSYEDIIVVTSLLGCRMYFDYAANHYGYGIGVLLISPHADHFPRFVRLTFFDQHPSTNNIVEYETCTLGLETTLELGIRQMELLIGRFDDLRYTHIPRAQNQFVDALATLASMIDIPADAIVCLLLIESRSVPAYCCLIDETKLDDGIIGKISMKSSNGHEFILVAIDYFTKWVKAASYARLTSSRVVSFIISHIIYRNRVPHELISDREEAVNRNIKRILRRMVKTSQDWLEKLLFALWANWTSFRTFTRATPYSLVYGMETMLPIEIEMGSLRVALEQ
ncbi:hypothetical protein CK203_057739 [Vitis vinifera]|uniref:Integrase catalytic domain-containing protein n=1 Tax=Vitis vinifera TaxID=29760 RepID=A0A438GMB3_VITVI|nr:hypothetical protein CK203_057739 [Vitis vinifera]